jgi:hypothetical protein
MPNAKYKIKGNNKIPNYDSEVEIDVDDQYEAYQKEIPSGTTPIPGGGGVITWFNAFGVREKASGKDAGTTYEVVLQALPRGKRLFALYGGEPHEIQPESKGKDKIRFTLNVGDPPLGSGP